MRRAGRSALAPANFPLPISGAKATLLEINKDRTRFGRTNGRSKGEAREGRRSRVRGPRRQVETRRRSWDGQLPSRLIYLFQRCTGLAWRRDEHAASCVVKSLSLLRLP